MSSLAEAEWPISCNTAAVPLLNGDGEAKMLTNSFGAYAAETQENLDFCATA
jgi:hypothetical protein